MSEPTTSEFFCDMTALSAPERARHQELAKLLRPAVLETKELADGYAARLPADLSIVLSLAEFVVLERRCCPFFTLALELDRDDGPLWLRITGGEGIKPFIRAEFGIAAG